MVAAIAHRGYVQQSDKWSSHTITGAHASNGAHVIERGTGNDQFRRFFLVVVMVVLVVFPFVETKRVASNTTTSKAMENILLVQQEETQ